MKVRPNVICSEFIGTKAAVAESRHQGYVGISGRIIDETKNTFVILHKGEQKRIIKNSAVFHFELFGGTVVEIDGKLLVKRPEDRLKKRIRRLW